MGPNSDPAAMGWPHRLQSPVGPGDGLPQSQEKVEKREKGEREADMGSNLAQSLRVRRHEGKRRGRVEGGPGFWFWLG